MQLGLDQNSLAKKAGTSRKWLIEVENGKPRAEIGLILRTLKALGITLSDAHEKTPPPPKRAAGTAPSVDLDRIINALKKRP